MRAKHT